MSSTTALQTPATGRRVALRAWAVSIDEAARGRSIACAAAPATVAHVLGNAAGMSTSALITGDVSFVPTANHPPGASLSPPA